jgi:hypothetical protein
MGNGQLLMFMSRTSSVPIKEHVYFTSSKFMEAEELLPAKARIKDISGQFLKGLN